MDAKAKNQVKQLAEWIDACSVASGGMVFFGGAGVSTESGIPDFRSQNGLYRLKYDYPPEEIISRRFFDARPREFYDFYCDRMLFDGAAPNAAHIKLAELEQVGKLSAVVTQNIDGLHQAAGSKTVYELHGSVHRNYCMRCGAPADLGQLLIAREASGDGIPRCECGGVLKPDVVLYEESLPQDTLRGAIEAISHAQLLVVAGTSLVVYPAAGLLDYFRGDHIAIVNLAPTSKDNHADLCIAAKVGEVFDALG